MHRNYLLICLNIILLCSQKSFADLETNSKLWLDSEVTITSSRYKGLKYFLNPQFRFINEFNKFNSGHFDAAILYQINPSLSVWLGGARIYGILPDNKIEQEERLWEQFALNVDTNSFQLINRTRLEERKRLAESVIALRFRQRLRMIIPIKMAQGYSIALSNEIFLNLNHPDWVSYKWFSQNRATIGLVIPINQSTFYEIGYLNQFLFNELTQMSNILFLKLSIQIN